MLASDEGDLLEDRKMDDPSKNLNEGDLNQIDFKAIQETLERAHQQEEDVKMEEPSSQFLMQKVQKIVQAEDIEEGTIV